MNNIPLIILIVSLAVALAGVAVWIYQLFSRKTVCDLSPAKGSDALGVLYAFTIGMLPWKKESARLHWLVYLRGIAFHLGILAGIVALVLNIFAVHAPLPVSVILCVLAGLGALSGAAAIISRIVDPMLRAISGPDDYIAPALVTIFLVAAALNSIDILGQAYFYVAASILSLYLPWSKVRHCVHFFFSRFKIGTMQGHRGLLAKPDGHQGKGI